MNEVVPAYKEKDLLVYFQQVRLLKAKEINDKNVDRTKDVKEEKKTFKQAMSNFGHFFERNIKNFDRLTKSIDESIQKFNDKNEKVISFGEAEEAIKIFFEHDKYGLAKLIFASTVILDDEYKYEYVEEGLKAVSIMLYGDEKTLVEIKEQLENNYKAISSKTISNVEQGVLVGVSAAWLALAFAFVPVLAVIPLAATTIAASDLLEKNKEQIKDEFKKSSSEKNAFYLALQCTYIQRIKNELSEDNFKDELDSILKNINELKSDLDYYLFVEKESVKDNKEKNKSFHEFDNRLIKILNIEK